LGDLVGDSSRIKGSVELVNFAVKYTFPNTLNLQLPKNAQRVGITGEGPDWISQIRAKITSIQQGGAKKT